MDLSRFNPFLEIDEYRFQELCRDLLGRQREDGVVTCRSYEVRGNAQYGADVLANCADGRSVDIGQCKRYSTLTATQIAKASDEFINHLSSHWKPRYDVRRFILMVACKLEKKDHHDEIQKQTVRFSELGIKYEVWEYDTLRLKLAPHSDLVRLHFPRPHEAWVEVICGVTSPVHLRHETPQLSNVTLTVLNEQFEKLASVFSGEQAEELERIRELNRRGRSREAHERIVRMREGAAWSVLDTRLRAKVLKVLASLSLIKDRDKARELINEAVTLDPGGDHASIRALLAYYEDGAASALPFVAVPSDTDTFNLKVALHLEKHDAPGALRLIESPPADITPDTETKRLRALALLETGEIEKARNEIAAAGEEKPEWESVKTVKSIIDYYDSLSPAALPRQALMWAEPVAWQFIKRDSESTVKLRAAEKHFAALAVNADKNDDQRMLFETWRLACLANDAERQQEAVAYCKELLDDEPTHPYALAWAITRSFDVDYSRSRAALERSIDEQLNSIDDARVDGTLALMGIHLKQGDMREARKVLARIRPQMEKVGAASLNTFWLGQIAVNEGKYDEALAIAQREKDAPVRRRLKAMALRAMHVKSGTWKPLSRYLEKSFRRTQDGEYLIELCYLRAGRNHWNFVADRADQLIESVATADAVRLATITLWNAKRPAKCLSVLEAHGDKFPGGSLPTDLLRLRVHCRARTGALAEAVTDAEVLVEQEDSTDNLITLMDAQLQKADLRGLVSSARKLLRRGDVDSASLLRAAKFVHLEDAELAKKLWRRVKDNVLDNPPLLSEALSLSYTFGTEREARPLFRKMQEYAAAGTKPFSSQHVSLLMPRMRKGAERQHEIERMYAKGELPLHFFAKESGYPLTDILHGLPDLSREETDLRRQAKIFAHHGGRTMRADWTEQEEQWRLHMDITALLTAADLNILNEVEEAFSPIRVSASLPKALLSQLEKLLSGQKVLIETHRVVLAALDAGKFRLIPEKEVNDDEGLGDLTALANDVGASWAGTAARALRESAILVEHLPMTSRDREMRPVTLPESLTGRVVNSRVVLDSLYTDGLLTDAEYKQSRLALGVEGNRQVEAPPHLVPDTKLYLVSHTVGTLAGANLLERTCSRFRTFADHDYIARIRAEVAGYDRYQRLAEWLKRLKDRVSDGLSEGIYKGLSVEDNAISDDSESAVNYDFHSLRDLLSLKAEAGDVVWIDDRYTNAYSNASGAPIITTADVLSALRHKGKLTEAEYFDKLLRLRTGNIRFLPLTAEEILFHLKQARVVNGSVVETESLATLRRYSAACLSDVRSLQKPPLPAGSPNVWGEMSFLLETTGAVSEAVATVWDEEEPLELAKARAAWLIDELFTGKFAIRDLLPNSDPQSDGVYYIGLDIGELLAKGIAIGDARVPENGQHSRRQQYYKWLNEKLIEPRIKADPSAVAAAARVFANFFSDQAFEEQHEDADSRAAERIVMQGLFLDLPEPIRNELQLEPRVMAWLGLKTGKFVNINSRMFPAAEFWSAAEQAVNGEPATITPGDAEGTFTVAEVPASFDGFLALEVTDANGAKIGKIETPLLGVLWRDGQKRSEWLRRNRFWFDCEQQIFEQEAAGISSLLDPSTRIDRANKWAEQSAEVFYRDKQRKFEAMKNVSWTDLTGISPEGLLRHHRLEPHHAEETKFTDIVSDATRRLLSEEGLEATLDRVSCLPLKIDDCLVEELRKLPTQTRNRIFERLALEWSAPVCKLHFIDLVLRSAPDDLEAMSYAESAVEDLYNETRGESDFNLFAATLTVVNAEIGYWDEARVWSPQVRLTMVWAHASRLFNLLHSVFGSPGGLTEWLLDPGRRFSPEVFARDTAYWNDCLHPHRLSHAILLTHGTASLLAANDAAALTALRLPELIKRMALRSETESPIPEGGLLRDAALEMNSTGSFLGGDRAEALVPLVGADGLDILASCNLKQIVRHAIDTLRQDPTSSKGWSAIALVVGDLPMYDDLREGFTSLVEGLNFENTLRDDVQTAEFALYVIALQRDTLPGAVLKRCEEWLVLLAAEKGKSDERVFDTESEDAMRPTPHRIVEITLSLTLKPGEPRASGEAFRDVMYQMLDRWHGLAGIIDTAVGRMLKELPLSQLHGMPELMLAVRSVRPFELKST